MPMHNLIEYNSNYSKITGSLQFYSKDGAPHFNPDVANTNNYTSFIYKAKLLENTEAEGDDGI